MKLGLLSVLWIALIAAAIGLIDVRLLPYLQTTGINSNGVEDVVTTLAAGTLGFLLAARSGLPTWWPKWPERGYSRPLLLIGVLASCVVALTTGIYLLTPRAGLPPWATSLTFDLAILLAVRAALGEEILFRLFILALIVWLGKSVRIERGVCVILGAVLSSFAFTLIHPGFYIPFLEGLLLAIIYLESGIVPVMVTHFLADAIPFLILSIRIQW